MREAKSFIVIALVVVAIVIIAGTLSDLKEAAETGELQLAERTVDGVNDAIYGGDTGGAGTSAVVATLPLLGAVVIVAFFLLGLFCLLVGRRV